MKWKSILGTTCALVLMLGFAAVPVANAAINTLAPLNGEVTATTEVMAKKAPSDGLAGFTDEAAIKRQAAMTTDGVATWTFGYNGAASETFLDELGVNTYGLDETWTGAAGNQFNVATYSGSMHSSTVGEHLAPTHGMPEVTEAMHPVFVEVNEVNTLPASQAVTFG